ncbi:MAG: NUDIX hydrolase [Actinopolymorphaceae bacterium]
MSDYVGELRKVVGHRPLLLAAAGVIVRDTAGAILLQRRTDDGRWGIPGGALEIGESLEETARRELTEETGLTAGDLELLDVYSGAEFFLTYANGDQAYVVGATFLAHSVSGESTPDGREGTELRYFSMAALPVTLNDYNRRLLERCRDRLVDGSLSV